MKNRRFESPFWNFISSLKLAAVSLLLLAGLIIWATFSQSAHKASQDWVNETFYHTWWFIGLQILILTNMWSATVRVFRGTWTQMGFIVIHVGVTLIMTGAFITHKFGVVGAQIVLWEGEETAVARSSEGFIADVDWNTLEPGYKRHYPSPFFSRQSNDVWQLREGGLTLRSVGYYPDARINTQIVPTGEPTGQRGIHLSLHLSGMPITPEKILSQSAPGNSWRKGLFALTYLHLEDATDDWPEGELILPKLELQLDVPGKTPESGDPILILSPHDSGEVYLLGEFEIRFEGFLGSAIFNDVGELYPDDGQWRNPAYSWSWWPRGEPEKKATCWYFVDHPDFHGTMTGFRARLRSVVPAALADFNTDVLVTRPSGAPELWQRLFTGAWRRSIFAADETGPLKADYQVKETVASLWLEDQFPHVEHLNTVEPLKDDLGEPVIGWVLEDEAGNTSPVQWGAYGQPVSLSVGSQQVSVTFSAKVIPLGFRVQLHNVDQINDPGTTSPATWYSDIEIIDDVVGAAQTFRVAMNDPVDYGGFRFFQSSYNRRGDAEQSGLQVARDPGFLIYYAGIVIIVLGMILNFYGKGLLARFERWLARR